MFIFVEMEHSASVEVTFALIRDSHPTSTGYSITTLMNRSKIQSVLLLFLIPFFIVWSLDASGSSYKWLVSFVY